MKLFRINSVGTAFRAVIGWFLLMIGLYFGTALGGSLLPVNARWSPPTDGTAVYLHDNGIHVSIILKRDVGDGLDFGAIAAHPRLTEYEIARRTDGTNGMALPDDRFPGPVSEYPYIMFGWGDARFYRETPTWAELRPGTAIAALFGSGQTMMHVDRLRQLPKTGVKRVVLRRHEYFKLLQFIAMHFPSGFEETANAYPGYGPDDRFFSIGPHWDGTPMLLYSAKFTCNNWAAEALKRAGVKTGYWTPLPFGVMWWH